MQVQQANVLDLHFFVFKRPSGWHPDAVTWKRMIFGAKCALRFVYYFVLLSVFIGWYVEYTDTWSQYKPSERLFILVINKLDAENLFYNKLISCLYMFRAPCAHRQEVKIVLYSLWYHHTYRWPSGAQVERGLCTGWPPTGDDIRCCIIQFWHPDDEHMVLETCRGMK
jgi:hypothetical protein